MGIITLTLITFLLGKELKNLSIKTEICEQECVEKISLNKIIWASLGFYVNGY